MLRLKIKYMNGTVIEQNINYLHVDNCKPSLNECSSLYFTVNRNPHPVIQEPVKIDLVNVKEADLYEVQA